MHENLCSFIHDELDELDRKVKNGGKLSNAEIEYGDMLAHFKKSLLTNEAMEEAGYSEHGYSYNRDWRDGDGHGMSYARGRRNAPRDARGRYSGDRGYSYAEDDMHGVIDEMRGMLADLPAEKQGKVRRFIDEMERM